MLSPTSASRASWFTVYVGTYTENDRPTGAKSEGLYVYRLEPNTGALTNVEALPGIPNPSFLALHPGGRYLYAVSEVGHFMGEPGGGVSALAIDATTGTLTHLNHQSSHGGHPCFVSVEAAGRYALVANFSGGSVAVLPIAADGRLRPASAVAHHPAHGSQSPFAHSFTLAPSRRFALAADLGLDAVLVYPFEAAHGLLGSPTLFKTPPGAGPRHLAFHPNGQMFYLINELNATVSVCALGANTGAVQAVQTIDTLPAGYPGRKHCAEIRLAPSGRFLYGSNRGHDSLVIYAIDPISGCLSLVGHAPTLGQNPRHFAIDPSGAFLLAANQDSDSVVVFRIEPQTGQLTPLTQVTVPAPVCVQIHDPQGF